MMIKDEASNLERCLNSVSNIMTQLNAELIVVDTGSSDHSVEIVKKYTDKIYYHPWNNNFSQMRNITIDYAKNDWIFILDADEEIINDTEIIEFFRLKKAHKKFNTLCIRVRNFTKTNNLTEYSELVSPRFFRNDGSFHYESVVHNIPIYKEPVGRIEGIIYHYGYVNDDPVVMEKKFQRTSKLLIAELEKDPKNIYYRFQLSVSYAMFNKWDEALTEGQIAYEQLEKMSLKDRDSYFYLYGHMLILYKHYEQYDAVIQCAEDAIKVRKDDIDTLFFIADAYVSKGKDYLSIPYYKRYLLLIKEYENHNLNVNLDVKIETIAYRKKAFYNLLMIEYELRHYKEVMTNASHDINLFIGDDIEVNLFKIILKSAIKTDQPRFIFDFYQNLTDISKAVFEYQLEMELPYVTKAFAYAVTEIFANGDSTYSRYCLLKLNVWKNDISLLTFQKTMMEFKILDPLISVDLLFQVCEPKGESDVFIQWVISNDLIHSTTLFDRITHMVPHFKTWLIKQINHQNTISYDELTFYITGCIYLLDHDEYEKDGNQKILLFKELIRLKKIQLSYIINEKIINDEQAWIELNNPEYRLVLTIDRALKADLYQSFNYLKRAIPISGDYQNYVFAMIQELKEAIASNNN